MKQYPAQSMDSRVRGNAVTDSFAVIPAKAGIHRCSPITHGRAPDTSTAGVTFAVVPVMVGTHVALPELGYTSANR